MRRVEKIQIFDVDRERDSFFVGGKWKTRDVYRERTFDNS